MAMILGITGGIGSGKSSVSRFLAAYCKAPFVDADKICHALLEKGQPGWQALHQAFGSLYEDAGGVLDRPKMRATLFQDKAFKKKIDSLLHPLAFAQMRAEISAVQKSAGLVLAEIPLLYEASWQVLVDKVLVVYARRGVQYSRVLRRDKVSGAQARRAILTQMDLRAKLDLADYVIDNSGVWEKTQQAAARLGDMLMARIAMESGQEKS